MLKRGGGVQSCNPALAREGFFNLFASVETATQSDLCPHVSFRDGSKSISAKCVCHTYIAMSDIITHDGKPTPPGGVEIAAPREVID